MWIAASAPPAPRVAPCAGAGIEMSLRPPPGGCCKVAPCAGAGIEIVRMRYQEYKRKSPPARGRGLKLSCGRQEDMV